jgi:hypothetical protein
MDTPNDLLADCIRAWDHDADFLRIWRDLLSIHPLVDGPPIQITDQNQNGVWLEIPLTTGQRLRHSSDDGFRLLSRVALFMRSRPGANAGVTG